MASEELLFSSSLWGPTCDTLDQVVERCLLPELLVGDWLIFSNMASLSYGEPTTLSNPDKPTVYYTIATADWYVCVWMAQSTSCLMILFIYLFIIIFGWLWSAFANEKFLFTYVWQVRHAGGRHPHRIHHEELLIGPIWHVTLPRPSHLNLNVTFARSSYPWAAKRLVFQHSSCGWS